MRTATKASLLALTIVTMVGGLVTGAMAETRWERNHPRRDQVNDRLQNQNRRINQEYREGEITRGQANRLHQEDRAIRHEERTMSGFNGGHITPAEQKALNQQENAVSGQIGR
jgi:ABC-type siderophore export system fused ATPase/permease subunit